MFSAVSLVLAFGIAICNNVAHGASLPDYIHVCKRSDPKVDKCIAQSIEDLRPYLKKGIPELGVPAAEPLMIPLIKIPGANPAETIAVGKNMKIFGTSDFTLNMLKMNLSQPKKPTVHFVLSLPKLSVEGDYEIDTRLSLIPIKGKGPMKLNAVNTVADAVMYGQVYKKGNSEYLRFTQMDLAVKMQDYNVQLKNLFNGDKLLEETTNKALNENKKELKQAFNPVVTKAIIEMTLDFANSITKNYPYSVLFPQ